MLGVRAFRQASARNGNLSAHELQPDQSAAKPWVRKPGGAIRRKDRTGISSTNSLGLVRVLASLTGPTPDSAVANANGLESQLLGSAGRLSRPATVKLLKFPPARAAQRCVSNDVAISGFCERKMILLAGAMGD